MEVRGSVGETAFTEFTEVGWQGFAGAELSQEDRVLYEMLQEEGYALFQGGLSHEEMKTWQRYLQKGDLQS
jgi:hypothetical protein